MIFISLVRRGLASLFKDTTTHLDLGEYLPEPADMLGLELPGVRVGGQRVARGADVLVDLVALLLADAHTGAVEPLLALVAADVESERIKYKGSLGGAVDRLRGNGSYDLRCIPGKRGTRHEATKASELINQAGSLNKQILTGSRRRASCRCSIAPSPSASAPACTWHTPTAACSCWPSPSRSRSRRGRSTSTGRSRCRTCNTAQRHARNGHISRVYSEHKKCKGGNV